MRTAIIGAGIAGLAAAVRLAVQGHQVEVFEAAEGPGGKLSEFSLGDYRFDLGPSLFTMPQYVDELFELAGENPKDYFSYERLPVVCHYFWEDGTRIHAHAAKEEFAEEVENVLDIPASRVLQMLSDAERKYQISGRTFLEKSLHKLSTWTNLEVLKAMLKIPQLDLFRSMDAVHRRELQHPKLVQLFNRFATYNGSNPYKAPGLLTIIPHFEHHFGAFLPEGGMYSISQSVYELARRQGVKFHFNTKVDEILVDNGAATGVRSGDKEQPFDQVVSNMDVFFTYRELLPQQRQPERILAQQKSTSALIFYWGIKKTFPELNCHNILFSEDYPAEFAAMERGEMYEDPTVYINKTSHLVPGDAPEGCENWFVMINAPCDAGQDWELLQQQTRQRTIAKINNILGEDIEPLIEEEWIMTPPVIQTKTGSHLGSLYGTSSNSKMAAFMRHPNFSHRISNLFFVGGSVHPGGGIPLCLLSAKIMSEMVMDSH
ncbi:1-hydroxycarotenoid 3,4-desaturase CrtD [Lewinella sp. LCG006]|uniref:1-hydroxycarotenoid 3,4-desaturase CrtD n=1 Tax=Lewinella sp. LCG006 TaxID=3231911 RepID=UPI00345F19B3